MSFKRVFVLVFLGLFCQSSWSEGLVGGEKYDVRVKKALEKLELKYTITDGNDFKLAYDMGEGRSQLVFIDSTTSKYQDFEIRNIYAAGYLSDEPDFPANVANRLLKENSLLKIGAWEKQGKFAVITVKISADAGPEAIKSAISIAIYQADTIEKELMDGKDGL